MATRFNLTTTAAGQSPAFGSPGIGGSWDVTGTTVRRKLTTTATKGTTAITTTSTCSHTGAQFGLIYQGVSEPLDAQTISAGTTFSGQIMAREFAGTDDVDAIAILIKAVSNDGSTETDCLVDLAYYDGSAELINNATCRNRQIAVAVTVTRAITLNQDDRLVIELGTCNTSGAGTTPQSAFKIGENATDLPANNTQTTDGAGWVEISQTLTFAGAGAITGSDGIVFSGTGNLTAYGILSGSATVAWTGTGGITAYGLLSGSGTIAWTGSGNPTWYALLSGSGTIALTGTGSIDADHQLFGNDGMVFSGSGTLSSYNLIDGSASIAFSGSGVVTAYGLLAGSADIVFSGSGNLETAPIEVAISGSGTISFGGSGELTAYGLLSGSAGIAFSGVADISGELPRYLIFHTGTVVAGIVQRTPVVMLGQFASVVRASLVCDSEVRASLVQESEVEIE